MLMIVILYFLNVLLTRTVGNEEENQFLTNFIDINKVPYVVLIVVKKHVYETRCTGTIIAEDWVLTAAHCFPSDEIDSVKIIAGMDDMDYTTKVQIRSPLRIVFHPFFRRLAYQFRWDLALIQIPKFDFTSEQVGILKLGDEMWPQDENKLNRTCQILSWRALDEITKNNTRLNAAYVFAEHGDNACNCLQSYEKKRVICLTHLNKNTRSCYDDSGGPLICNGFNYGVAHFIYDSFTCTFNDVTIDFVPPTKNSCIRNSSVSVFMYICPELNWIRQYVNTVPKRPESCQASVQSVKQNWIIFLLICRALIGWIS